MTNMIHNKHRERLKARFLSSPDSFEDHELLELLLFYAIPRVNTNEIAHRLLERFGSLQGIFNAEASSLMEVDGIGKSSALYIRSLSVLLSRYARSNIDTRKLLDSPDKLEEYMKSLFIGTEKEAAYLLLLDASKRLIICEKVGEGNSVSSTLDLRQIMTLSLNSNAAFAILVHNHPGGKAIPSGEDLTATGHIAWSLDKIGVKFVNHFIVADGKCVPILSPNMPRL